MRFTVSKVAVAVVTVPTAPLLNTIVLLAGVELKPTPAIATVVALMAKLDPLVVTTGFTVATSTAVPLDTELLVTTTVRLPTEVGLSSKVTVSDVGDAVVTVPAAPLLNATVLFAARVSNPKPAIVIVSASDSRLDALLVTTGTTVATLTAAELLAPSVVTIAVRSPADVGAVVKLIVNDVAVALPTVPAAPLLNTTVFWLAVVLKPKPLIVIDVPLAEIVFELFAVTTGRTVATCTSEPLAMPLTEMAAERIPAVVGFLENVTVSDEELAVVTVPIAPLSNVTMLCDATASKPKPPMTMFAAAIDASAVLLVTTGVTLATTMAVPLLMDVLVIGSVTVTTAVRFPAVVGFVVRFTVNDVLVAPVTTPTAPLVKVIVLLAAVGSKPKPLMVSVDASAAKSEVLLVTIGRTLAT